VIEEEKIGLFQMNWNSYKELYFFGSVRYSRATKYYKEVGCGNF